MSRIKRILLITLSIIASVLVLLCVHYLLSFHNSGLQIESYVQLQRISSMLDKYHKVNGNYPSNYLSAIPQDQHIYYSTDSWGNKFYYISNNRSFTLVSFGKGGSPDSTIYSRLPFPLTVHKQPIDAISVLGQYEEDQVVTNRGWYSAGGK